MMLNNLLSELQAWKQKAVPHQLPFILFRRAELNGTAGRR